MLLGRKIRFERFFPAAEWLIPENCLMNVIINILTFPYRRPAMTFAKRSETGYPTPRSYAPYIISLQSLSYGIIIEKKKIEITTKLNRKTRTKSDKSWAGAVLYFRDNVWMRPRETRFGFICSSSRLVNIILNEILYSLEIYFFLQNKRPDRADVIISSKE